MNKLKKISYQFYEICSNLSRSWKTKWEKQLNCKNQVGRLGHEMSKADEWILKELKEFFYNFSWKGINYILRVD